ncbi:sigma-70 family RNA polymerase sigma factor [Sorangium sp. So ce448]|uniref:RNA polymerase sigma factor n=1 Tax=Sorangium sp. So ce448 TaxID=3133314 RepID=UPI003F5E2921
MAEIADEHFSFIARYLARLGVRAQDIEDVAQEVLAGAYRALPRFDPSRGTVRSWLMGIATHQASNHFRRAHRRHERLRPFDDLAALPDVTPDSEQHAIARDRRCVLDKLLQEMPMERRCVFVAHELEEIDMAEIAQQLSIPLSTAWSRHRLAWVDIEAAMRRWQARQRGRGLALIPFSAGALVQEARTGGEGAPTLLTRLYRSVRGVFSPWPWKLPIEGSAPTRTGSLHIAASIAVPLASAAAVIALTLGALRAASTPAAAGTRAATGLAMAVIRTPPPPPAPPPPSPAALSLPSPAALSLPSPAALSLPSPAAPLPPPGAAVASDAPQGGRIAGAGNSRATSAALPAQKAAPRPSGRATLPSAGPSGASNDQEIAAERTLIDGAITALSRGRYAEAKRRLIEHRMRFPAGRLTAERNAALRALRARTAAAGPRPLL